MIPHCDILTLFTVFLILEIKAIYYIFNLLSTQHVICDYFKYYILLVGYI